MKKNQFRFLFKSKVLDKKLLNDVKQNISQTIKNFDAYLIQSCNNFQNFTGNDVDAFYKKRNRDVSKTFKKIILRNITDNDLRLHINSSKNVNFLSLDIYTSRFFFNWVVIDFPAIYSCIIFSTSR